MRSPFTPKAPLTFCQYNGSVCCNSTEDMQLQNLFKTMDVSDLGCASLVKSILCSFSAELYRIESVRRKVPILCNSTVSPNSRQYKHGGVDFCSKVWDECQNVSLLNSPFSMQVRGGTPSNSTSKLSDIWQSKNEFCNTFGGSSESELFCFDGGPVLLNNSEIPTPPSVYADTEFGMMGLAFHPNYVQNGRFFASFNCDKVKWPECSGRCSCNSDVGCDPSKLGSDNGAQPCQYHSIIAEFTANGTTSQPSSVTSVKPLEVRRIFTMGLPFTSHHAGQILFGPKDGFLYFMMGDGGSIGDPYNFSQNKKSLLGKIMRLDIDNLPSAMTITDLGLWGNYSVPGDNPFSEDKELQPEIWALGFRNPWRCSFDLERPSYFLCADVGQDQYEEADIITKGGNYGWRIYEGPSPYNPQSPGGNTSATSINPIFPVMGYNHSDVNKAEGSASITGGYFYRSTTDPCMHGRYLYADLFAGGIWTGIETPEDSGNFTSTKIPVSCALDSPIQCSAEEGSSLPALGFIFSFGQDNRKDIFILANSGLYRVVRPSRCNYTCSKEIVTSSSHPKSVPSPAPSASCTRRQLNNPFVLELLIFFSTFFGFFL
ncbi:unnamed protein product [Prunus armeniaca]|uniref:Glucose/Sorbosone dehydrogenase domain-containing protein n=1 Tax=Prunus armeniaca TaxID=36596 RepID=A0A6J5WVA0_PRUAR|nr:unnamed protein product [Prunus armeniaca]